MSKKRKNDPGHGQQCGDCVGGGESKGLNGNRKNTTKKHLNIINLFPDAIKYYL